MPVVGVLAIYGLSESEGRLADAGALAVLGVLRIEGGEDGLSVVAQCSQPSEDGVGLVAGGWTPVSAQRGAVATVGNRFSQPPEEVAIRVGRVWRFHEVVCFEGCCFG